MTNREFFNAVIANAINADVIAHAQASLEKLDARNAKRSSMPSKTQRENEPIKAQIVEAIGDGMTAKAIGEKVGISTQKASALCRQLVESGLFSATEEKVDKRKVKVYRRA